MKKIVAIVLTIACMTALCVTAFAEGKRVPIAQLNKGITLWNETYSDEFGNTIHIDTPIVIPEVDALPVVSVIKHRDLDESIYSDYAGENIFMPPRKYSTSNLNLHYKYDFQVSSKLNVNYLDLRKQFYYPEDMHVSNGLTLDWDMKGEGTEYSFKDAYQIMVKKYQEIMRKYGISDGDYEVSPRYANTLDFYYKGKRQVYHEAYEFDCVQKIRGIPVVTNGNAPYDWQNNAFDHEYVFPNHISLHFSSESSFCVAAEIWEETSVLYDDIRVISFDEIKPKLVFLIQKGHICEIYKIELAYLTYFNEYRDAKKGMILVPTWIVHCQYRFNTKDYSEIVPQETIYGSGGYQILAFNAQTGEYRDPMAKGIDRSDCPPIIQD